LRLDPEIYKTKASEENNTLKIYEQYLVCLTFLMYFYGFDGFE